MRADDNEELLAGYVRGPAAATEPTLAALPRAATARAILLVEGSATRSRSRPSPPGAAAT
jgi:hypothetical protein